MSAGASLEAGLHLQMVGPLDLHVVLALDAGLETTLDLQMMLPLDLQMALEESVIGLHYRHFA